MCNPTRGPQRRLPPSYDAVSVPSSTSFPRTTTPGRFSLAGSLRISRSSRRRSLCRSAPSPPEPPLQKPRIEGASPTTRRAYSMSDQSDDSIDPAEIYTIEDFIAEQNFLDSFARRIEAKMKAKFEAGPSNHRSAPRRYIDRNRERAHEQLVSDYFAEVPLYTDEMFRRRFRMRRHVFLCIVRDLGEWSPYFTQRRNCTGRLGLSPLQKCTAAIRMLAYGTAADTLDEYLKIAEITAMECLEYFVQGVIEKFGNEYLRSPTQEDMEHLKLESLVDSLEWLSVDCMHWRWENCPTAWKGQYTRGDQKVPTIILEAVASYDLCIWHAFFGGPRSNNDINALNQSPLFIEKIKGEAP